MYVYVCSVLSCDDIELRSDARAVLSQLWPSRASDVRYLTAELSTCIHLPQHMLPILRGGGGVHGHE